jgi:hypothetical protein
VKSKAPSRIPVLLSAIICPGSGQLVQKRWVAGTIFMVGFLCSFFWLLTIALQIIADYYRMGFDFNYEPAPPDTTALLPPLLIALAFYLANLFDVLAAQLRIARMEREKHFANPDS